MKKALDGKARFNRWGKHYLRALGRAHQLQVCTNFMDAGLQGYGGSMFCSYRATGDRLFMTIPAPKRPDAPRTVDAALAELGLTMATAPWDVIQGIREQLHIPDPVAVPVAARGRAFAPPPAAAPPPAPARSRTPSPERERYYGGGGGG